MVDFNKVSEFAQEVVDRLPPGLKSLPGDCCDHIQAAMTDVLAQHGWVTREEFDIQARVLQRTRMRLEELEERVKALEASRH